MRRPCSLLVAALVATLCVSFGARSEDDSVRRELAWELIQVSGGGDMAEQLADVILASVQQSYGALVQQLLASQPSLTAEQRALIEARLADHDRFSQKFSTRLREQVDFEELLRGAYVPLYAEHFTEPELREILAFQKSPVGRKAAELMPTLMQQGMARSMPILQPVVMSVLGQVLQEEQAAALQQQ